MASTILVTGATGKVGSEVVRQLAAANVPLRALVRQPARAASLQAPGVELAQGDYTDQQALLAALSGIEQLFLLTVPHPDQLSRERAIIDAARAAGVRRIVKLSAIGSSSDSPLQLGRAHAEAEQYIAASGLDYTHLRPHSFMQNLLGNASTISGQGAFYAAAGQGKIGAVDVRDIAAVAVAVLTNPGHSGQTYTITGPESISHYRMAEIFSEVLGKPVSYVDQPAEQLVESLKGFGVPAFLAEDLGVLNQIYAAGHADLTTDVVANVAGKQPISFEQFVRDHVEAFRNN